MREGGRGGGHKVIVEPKPAVKASSKKKGMQRKVSLCCCSSGTTKAELQNMHPDRGSEKPPERNEGILRVALRNAFVPPK